MNYSSISTTEYNGGYTFVTLPRSKYFCCKWFVHSERAAQLRRLLSSVAEEIWLFCKLGSFVSSLDHIWTTNPSVCTGTNERLFQGKERESEEEVGRRWNSLSFTLGLWDVSRGGTFFFSPSCLADLCNTWLQSWSETFPFPWSVQRLQWRWETDSSGCFPVPAFFTECLHCIVSFQKDIMGSLLNVFPRWAA